MPSDSTAPADATALCAFQYFENVRNFLTGLQGLGLPTFEASDLQKVTLLFDFCTFILNDQHFFFINTIILVLFSGLSPD